MKLRHALVVVAVAAFAAPMASADLVDLVGDRDGFGVGAPIASGLNYLDYGAYWTDYRESDDPSFTDYWFSGDRSWTHGYALGGMTPGSAVLELYLAGIADVGGWTADVRLNGVSIGTIPYLSGGHSTTRLLTFDVPVSLVDGSSSVIIDVSSDGDGYIVDYSQLTIRPVPAPGAALLGVIGLGLVGWIRRQFA